MFELDAQCADLLFRLDVVRIDMPPLRSRADEFTGLLAVFNAEFATLYDQPALEFEEEAILALRAYRWPGNIRQLRTVVERMHVLSPEEEVSVAGLVSVGRLHDLSIQPLPPRSLKHVRYDELRRVLRNSGGSVKRAAEVFGVHRSTIYRWLREEAVIGVDDLEF